jgi:5'(3')-deoxyribonucleotidase
MKKPVILLDCDGVIADCVGGMIEYINDELGTIYTPDDVKTYETFDIIKFPGMSKELKTKFWDMVHKGGWCLNMKPLPGAIEAVYELNQIAKVYIVTKPVWRPAWLYERFCWINHNLGIPEGRIIYAADKYRVEGDMLIDDKVSNVRDWKKRWLDGVGVLWDQPYNQRENVKINGLVRCKDWNVIIQMVQRMPGSKVAR